VYLYRAVDSSGATIDFLLSAKRDAAAAERFLTKALGGENHPAPRVINTDKDAAYPPAIVQLKAEAALEENCCHRPVQYLNNVLEQAHRAIKRRVRASQHFRSFWGAWHAIAGYEAIQIIRKGQAWGSAAGAKVGLLHLTAGPKQIENRVHYSPYINASGTIPRFSFRNYRIHQRPLRVRQIRCVYPHSCLQNLERSLRTRLVTARTFQTASKF
jgi:hypothetical protein